MKRQVLFPVTIFAGVICLSALIVAGESKSSTEANAPSEKAEDPEYAKVIEGRTQKIVDALGVEDKEKEKNVHDAIMGHYRFLNSWDENNKAKVKELEKKLSAIQAEIDKINGLKKTHHEKFVTELEANLAPEQVEMVKDKLTYDKVQVTYKGFCDMLPELREVEKAYILKMLKEARDIAVDGGSSEEKTAVFGKYKGKINNFLSACGYDLKKASEGWQARMRAEREKKNQSNSN